jgi:hypothetical protein
MISATPAQTRESALKSRCCCCGCIRQGSIKVDFNLEHTYYLDQRRSGYEEMKLIMEQELGQARFGTFRASLDGFKFEKVAPHPGRLFYQCKRVVLVLIHGDA